MRLSRFLDVRRPAGESAGRGLSCVVCLAVVGLMAGQGLGQGGGKGAAALPAQHRADSADSATAPPEVEELSEGVFRIGAVILDSNRSLVILPGRVNMSRGMIELLACAEGGKVHESVLVIEAEPYHMQVSLLLLGLAPGGGIQYQGDPKCPEGDSVWVWVQWEDKEKWHRVRAEDMVFDLVEEAPMSHTPWVFTGSDLIDGQFGAQIVRTLITTYHDPLTILDNPLPEGGDDTVYRVNEDLVPPVGTPVLVIVTTDPNAIDGVEAEALKSLMRGE